MITNQKLNLGITIILLTAMTMTEASPKLKISSPDGMPQVLIPAGKFTMGANDTDGYGRKAETPPHTVYLDSYWIDQHEVTNEQFAKFLNKRTGGNRSMIYRYCDPGSPFCRITINAENICGVEPGYEKHPVCGIAWAGASNYAKYVKRRLPSEAEWEKAARGNDKRNYPWGNKWIATNANTAEAGPWATVPIGSIAGDRSPYDIWDMAGNASEWVRDIWDEAYYIRSPSHNPINDGTSSRYTVRGGAWCLTEWDARTTSRQILIRSTKRRYMGFRCAETIPPALPAATKVSKHVIFYAPFDRSLNASFAQGRRRPLYATKGIKYKKGHRGQAALLGETGDQRFWVNYDTMKNFSIKEGTMALWIQPNGWDSITGGLRYFFMIRDEAHCRIHLYRTLQGNLSLLTGNGIYKEWDAIYAQTETWQDKEWIHLAITWNPERVVTLYVNGIQAGQTTMSPEKYFRGLPDLFSLGQSQQWSLDGKRAQTAIDEVVIFDRALSPEEVVAEMERKSNP